MVALFRAWDVEKNGILDISGVPRARCESFLEILQLIAICFMFGYSIYFLIFIPDEYRIILSIGILWIIVDSMITLLTRPFIYLGMYLMIQGEITRNIYTLHFL